ncbi:MAG: hypothetical protein JXB14_01570 [Candidatus Altiarchaeota archaeon]|nr:hypothetical protein [Candidatus Altiarchaeota archaeon]
MARLDSAHIFQSVDEAGVTWASTWGEVFGKLEKYKIKGLVSLGLSISFFAGMLILFYYHQYMWGMLSLVFSTYYYRNYTGIYALYRNLYGRRPVIIQNLKVK